jgi:tetraacyldisaccharide 4'-kinase
MTLINQLESAWYGHGRAPWWTGPLSGLYGAATSLRRALYRLGWLRSTRLAVPVIVIGNLSVGGTGKTPLTIAVGERLRALGWKPGVVSRGYGGTQHEPMLLTDASTPSQVGDEPCLIHAAGLPVAIGRDRAAAAALLLGRGCDVVIADDGLQHYALGRDVEICVIDGVRRFGNGRLLPAGPLREPMSRLDDVDFRVCNGGDAARGEYAMQLRGDEAVALLDGRRQSLASFRGQRVHAVAAIGNPARFFSSLRAAGIEPIEHAFADHHAFVAAELDFVDQLPLLMTDKDAVKCRGFAQPHWWRVPVRADMAEAFHAALDERLRAKKTV